MSESSGTVIRLYERLLDYYRAAGMAEQQAQEAARHAAVGRDGAQAAEQLREALAAREAQAGQQPDGFDRAVAQFQRLGLSPAAARTAAIGRGRTEVQAREAYRVASAQQIGEQTHELVESAVSGLPVKIAEVVRLVAQQAQAVLHKSEAEARRFAVTLVERDRRRFGDEYAVDSGRAFAAGLAAVAATEAQP